MVEYSDTLSQSFSALADPTRREIVLMLMNNDSLRVSDLAEPFEMSLAGVSKHLKVLEAADLIARTKKGREAWFRLNSGPLVEVQDWLKFHEKFWVDRFENLDRILKKNLS